MKKYSNGKNMWVDREEALKANEEAIKSINPSDYYSNAIYSVNLQSWIWELKRKPKNDKPVVLIDEDLPDPVYILNEIELAVDAAWERNR
jgi:hypothetical protein